MESNELKKTLLKGTLFLLLSGCKASGPEGLGTDFVDAYYIEFDLEKAGALAAGPARRRLTREAKLATPGRTAGAEKLKTRVYYEPPKVVRQGDNKISMSFQLTIKNEDTRLEKRAVVLLAKQDNRWVVFDFHEGDPGQGLRLAPVRGATSTSTPGTKP